MDQHVAVMGTLDELGDSSLTVICEDLVSQLSGLDVSVVASEDLSSLSLSLARVQRSSLAVLSLLALELQRRRSLKSDGYRNGVDQLCALVDLSNKQASELVECAAGLKANDQTLSAFVSGELSSKKAHLIARGLTDCPDRVDELLSISRSRSTRELSDAVSRFSCVNSPQAQGRRNEQQRSLRRCSYFRDDDDMFNISVKLLPGEGFLFKERFDEIRERLFAQKSRNRTRFTYQSNCADAFVEMLSRCSSNDASSKSPPRLKSMLIVNVESLKRGYVSGSEQCEIAGVGPVCIDTAKSLLGESLFASLYAIVIDIKSITSLKRYYPSYLKDALGIRDSSCVVSGCSNSAFLEKDHHVALSDGGPTSYDNLRHLCKWHHRLVTYDGFRVEKRHSRWVLLDPGGHVLNNGVSPLENTATNRLGDRLDE